MLQHRKLEQHTNKLWVRAHHHGTNEQPIKCYLLAWPKVRAIYSEVVFRIVVSIAFAGDVLVNFRRFKGNNRVEAYFGRVYCVHGNNVVFKLYSTDGIIYTLNPFKTLLHILVKYSY